MLLFYRKMYQVESKSFNMAAAFAEAGVTEL